jgi:hypothetical protein
VNHQQAFNEMMIRFEIEAKKLALDSKVSEIQISRFRNGKQDLHADALLRLLNSVSKEARQWYLSAVLGDAHLGPDMSSLVWNLNSQELSTLVHLVAERLKSGKSAEVLQVAAKV